MDGVSSTNPGNAGSIPGAPPANQTLNMASFLNLLVTQLENQNPLQPMDDAQFYGQIAQLGQVQGLNDLKTSLATQTKSIDDLASTLTGGITQQLSGLGAIYDNLSMSQAASLVGKHVTASPKDANGNVQAVSGTVLQVTVTDKAYMIRVQQSDGTTADVKMSDITSVAN